MNEQKFDSVNNNVYLRDNIVYKDNSIEKKWYVILKKHKIPTPKVKIFRKKDMELYYYPSVTLKEKPTEKSYKTLANIYTKLHQITGKNNTIFKKKINEWFLLLPKYMQHKTKHFLTRINGITLLHRDPSPSNVLVGKHIKLIDFEFCTYGDAEYDLGLIISKHPQKYHQTFFSQYKNEYDNQKILFYIMLFENYMFRWARKHKKKKYALRKKEARNTAYNNLIR